MSENKKTEHLAFLAQLAEADLPELFTRLDDQESVQIREWIEVILEKERAGLDRLFDSMSQTMKYIPNFILHAITSRYVSPPIAARIAARLAFKQALSVASGVPPDYLGETALNIEAVGLSEKRWSSLRRLKAFYS